MKSIRSSLRKLSHARRKIQPEDYPAIKAEHAQGVSAVEIAKRRGVAPSTIYDIVAGRVWRGVGLEWGGKAQ